LINWGPKGGGRIDQTGAMGLVKSSLQRRERPRMETGLKVKIMENGKM